MSFKDFTSISHIVDIYNSVTLSLQQKDVRGFEVN